MRKISKTRTTNDEQVPVGDDRLDARPRRVPGATITSWHGSPEVDLDALFAGSANGATVAGSAATSTAHSDHETVALSDGTRITFATPNQFKAVATV
jgi:hypothetical protein